MNQYIVILLNSIITAILASISVVVLFFLIIVYNGYSSAPLSFYILYMLIPMIIIGPYILLIFNKISRYYKPGILSKKIFSIINTAIPVSVFIIFFAFLFLLYIDSHPI